MDQKNTIEHKTILITGGTGSFGHAVVERLLSLNPVKLIIFSRDENKQFDMGNRFNNDKLRFIVGDVRDMDSVNRAMHGVDFVFHAAALKQVANCEFFPLEAIKTNTLGAHNIINAAISNNVKRVVLLSTDKAVHPIGVMGMTKALMERIMLAAAREKRGQTKVCVTRYGNVIYTRGSVIPVFIEQMKGGKPITLTNKNMTRFMMTIRDSVDLILYALMEGGNGAIYIKKTPAATMGDLAAALVEIFDYEKGTIEIGIRPGEKMHESLISSEEILRVEDLRDYFKIGPEIQGVNLNGLTEGGYTSANTKRLEAEELRELLLSLEEIQEELRLFRNKVYA
ncbi:MAG: SDR family NAD(P)-dependent oxidoreductase [Candidatus Doudnabacteria bacterium]|nr:SDR family NAD(P)-dependent oxidoreductase [Candidatus Doudnabacteria bacterium]